MRRSRSRCSCSGCNERGPARRLPQSNPRCEAGLREARWPGRLEVIGQEPFTVIDVGHTPDGIRQSLAGLKAIYGAEDWILVTGVSIDKNASEIVDALAPSFDTIICTTAHHKGARRRKTSPPRSATPIRRPPSTSPLPSRTPLLSASRMPHRRIARSMWPAVCSWPSNTLWLRKAAAREELEFLLNKAAVRLRIASLRHARACPGHPRLIMQQQGHAWPGMGAKRRAPGSGRDEKQNHSLKRKQEMADLLEGFARKTIKTAGAEIVLSHGGKGPPLLLMHGNPFTHVCWHKVAPRLAAGIHRRAARPARLWRQLEAGRRRRSFGLFVPLDGGRPGRGDEKARLR